MGTGDNLDTFIPHNILIRKNQSQTMWEEEFISDALAARNHAQETGIVYEAKDVHEYILARARGENLSEPKPTCKKN